MTRTRGFTLIELLIVIAMFGILVGSIAPITTTLLKQNDFTATYETIISTLAKARSYAIGGRYDSNWGIKLQTNQVVVFAGTSYVARNPSYDETVSLPGDIDPPIVDEVVFIKRTGYLSAPTSVTLASNGATNQVNINQKGIITY